MLKKLSLALILTLSAFAQHDASINLNNDDIELNANIDLGELNQSDYPDIYFLTLGFLDVDNAERTNPLLSAGFMLRQKMTGISGMRFGVGLKGTYTKVGDNKHSAIPLGVEAAYTLPLNSPIPVIISGEFFYSPSVLTFKDANKYIESRLELGLQVMEQGTIFAGYRKIDTNFKAADYTYNETGYFGFRVRF